MPSAQVSLVIATEKEAAGIEQDARLKARQIMDDAKQTAAASRKSIDQSADITIKNIMTDASAQSDTILSKEALTAAGLVSDLRSTAARNKDKTILAAVHVLSGRS